MFVYLDHNATTPIAEEVLQSMLPYLRDRFGNPSSGHRFGRLARAAVDSARAQVAELVKAHPSQVIFTSGGTEANNWALQGACAQMKPGRIVIGATEHPSVTNLATALQGEGWRVDIMAADKEGRLDLAPILPRRESPMLVSAMMANNETGVIQDVTTIGQAARARGAVLHTDAVQAAGKIDVDFSATLAHLMSISAHKLQGPKGVGALIVDKAVDMRPLLHGGGQEKARRGGTENVAGIVGFGTAAAIAQARLSEFKERMGELRERVETGLRAIGGIEIFAANALRLPNTVCFGVPGVEGETLLLRLDKAGMAVSSGSACASGSKEASPVLKAMGISADLAGSAIRVSLGWSNTAIEVDAFLAAMRKELETLRPRPQYQVRALK